MLVAAVERWERGETRPDSDQLAALAALYGCRVGHLFGEEDLPDDDEPGWPRDAFRLLVHPSADVTPALLDEVREAVEAFNQRYRRRMMKKKRLH